MLRQALAIGGRPIGNFALILGFVGALCLVWAEVAWLATAESTAHRQGERVRALIGAVLIAGAFLLLSVERLLKARR